MTNTMNYIELAPFKVKPGVADMTVLRIVDEMEDFIKALPGFLRRETLRMQDDSWLDIVHWRDQASAEGAMELVHRSDACQQFMSILDESSPPMQHGRQVRIQTA